MEGGRRVAALCSALAACVVGAAGCGESDGPSRVATVASTHPVAAFAPLVRLHPRETSFPIAADRFIERSSVKWAGSTCVGRANVATGHVAKRKTPGRVPFTELVRLGDPRRSYRFESLTRACKPRARPYRASELTRPYDPGPRPVGLPSGEGFYLDALSDSLDGDPPFVRRDGRRVLGDVAAYYELDAAGPGRRLVSYWLLFGRGEAIGANGRELVGHEGDWQRVQVLLARRGARRWKPLSISLGPDGAARAIPWHELEGDGTHPVLYSARKRHALYTETGSFKRRVPVVDGVAIAHDETATCDDCLVWPTWKRLLPLEGEPWYGFGGGWGYADYDEAASGPLGPRP